MDEETAMMLDWFNGWYSSKTHVKLCKISFFYQHKDELWIMMSDGRGLTYKEFGEEFEPASKKQMDNIWKGWVK